MYLLSIKYVIIKYYRDRFITLQPDSYSPFPHCKLPIKISRKARKSRSTSFYTIV